MPGRRPAVSNRPVAVDAGAPPHRRPVAALVADSTALVDLIEKSIARRAPGAARDELQKRWTLVKALQKSSRRVAIKRHGGAKSSHGAAAKRKLDGDRIHTNRSLAPST